jgi:hypothetical protein
MNIGGGSSIKRLRGGAVGDIFDAGCPSYRIFLYVEKGGGQKSET